MHIKHRPTSFDQFIGNETVVKSVKSLLTKSPVRPIFFYGVPGIGKTTLAHIIAYEFGANEHGIIDRNCVNYSGVDEMREMINSLNSPSFLSPKRVLILDEVFELSPKARKVLLKPLEIENLRNDILFIACTTDIQGLEKQFLDRFHFFTLKPFSTDQSLHLLNSVVEKEELNIPKWLKVLIIEKSDGIPRRILTGLSKVNIDNITEDEANELLELNALADETNIEVFNLFKIILSKADWTLLRDTLKSLLKEVRPNEIKFGLMNIIGARLLSEYNRGDDNRFLVEAFNILKESDSTLEKAGLISAITNIYLRR